MKMAHSAVPAKPSAAPSRSQSPSPSLRNLSCCCGKGECAYLEHNFTALGSLEKDLRTAAQLGQVRGGVHQ